MSVIYLFGKVCSVEYYDDQFLLFEVIKFTYYGSERDTTPNILYIWCAFSYVGAMLASNAALQFINYPTQVNFHCNFLIFSNRDGFSRGVRTPNSLS